jgi:hypothetical protein
MERDVAGQGLLDSSCNAYAAEGVSILDCANRCKPFF